MPNKIFCFNREFYLKENIYFGDTFTLMHYIQEEDLNDEVEIIEEEKKIPEKIEEKEIEISMAIGEQICANKINEIIDYLKSKGD